MRLSLSVTPADAVSGGQTDTIVGDRIGSGRALLLILGLYGTIYASGGISSILTALGLSDASASVADYSDPGWYPIFGRMVSQIALAIAVLVVVRVYVLRIPWPTAGVAARSDRAWPSFATLLIALVSLLVAGQVKALVEGTVTEISVPTDTAHNAWSLWAILRSFNAGIVEEITIVALPVLLLRRAGWHPVAIVALSVAMRYPFHIYHGVWSSLPWALIWGGAYCAAFLYLRRLLPLVVFHAFWDIQIMLGEAWGQAGSIGTVAIGIALTAWLVRRMLRDRWTRLDSRSQRPSLGEAWHLARAARSVVFGAVVLAALVVAIGVVAIQDSDPSLWLAAAVLIIVIWAMVAVLMWSVAIKVNRNEQGAIESAVTWADNRWPGVVEMGIVRDLDILDAVRVVAEHEPSATTIMVRADDAEAAKFAAHGHRRSRPSGGLGKYVMISRSDALNLPSRP